MVDFNMEVGVDLDLRKAKQQLKKLVGASNAAFLGGASGGGKESSTDKKAKKSMIGLPDFMLRFLGPAAIASALVSASPRLFKVLGVIGIATLRVLKPLGDLMSTILKPLAGFLISLGKAETIGEFLSLLVEGAFDLGVWLAEQTKVITKGLFDIGVWLGEETRKIVSGEFDLGAWLEWAAGTKLGAPLFNLGKWLGVEGRKIVEGVFDLGVWLGEEGRKIVEGAFDLGVWLGEEGRKIVTGAFDLGAWLKTEFNKLLGISESKTDKTNSGILTTSETRNLRNIRTVTDSPFTTSSPTSAGNLSVNGMTVSSGRPLNPRTGLPFQTAFASGGIVTKPTTALIGEAGPEAVIPLSSGGFGNTINITVNGVGLGADQLARRIASSVDRELARRSLAR